MTVAGRRRASPRYHLVAVAEAAIVDGRDLDALGAENLVELLDEGADAERAIVDADDDRDGHGERLAPGLMS